MFIRVDLIQISRDGSLGSGNPAILTLFHIPSPSLTLSCLAPLILWFHCVAILGRRAGHMPFNITIYIIIGSKSGLVSRIFAVLVGRSSAPGTS